MGLGEYKKGKNMRNRLTEKNSCGNWWLKGVKWQQLYTGQTITKEVQEKLYAALFKLMEYEKIRINSR